MKLGLNLHTKKRGVKQFEPEAKQYISAVETADGQPLERKVKGIINNFVVGCKADGIWDAIKACCILAGARTLSGALVPLKGVAPTNVNFISENYDRKTGLKGDALTKTINSSYRISSSGQMNVHISCFRTEPERTDANDGIMGDGGAAWNYALFTSSTSRFYRSKNLSVGAIADTSRHLGIIGISRNNINDYDYIYNQIKTTLAAVATEGTATTNMLVFNRAANNGRTSARISFYSIGEALDLNLLNNRVNILMSAIDVAIISQILEAENVQI